MGSWLCFGETKKEQGQTSVKAQQKPVVENVDVVKFKLKQARDKINQFINLKNKDLAQIEKKIQQKVPAFKQTGNKKQLVPLLSAKINLQKMIDNGDVRLTLVNRKLEEVEMQQLNAETIDVLDDSNKYIRQIQDQLEKKDWRNVLSQAQNKYEIQWPDDSEEIQNDPTFQEMWKELGGDKLQSKKAVEKKSVNVEVQNQKQTEHTHNKKQMAIA